MIANIYFKDKQKNTRTNVFCYVKVYKSMYILKVYSMHYTLR